MEKISIKIRVYDNKLKKIVSGVFDDLVKCCQWIHKHYKLPYVEKYICFEVNGKIIPMSTPL